MIRSLLRKPRPAVALPDFPKPDAPAQIIRQGRFARPAPDMLTINREALAIAVANLAIARANRELRPWDREEAMGPDAKVLAGWLSEAPDRADYDARVQALNAQVTIGGAKKETSNYDWSIVIATSGQALLNKAKAIYKQLTSDQ
ncbi:hypothetical protein [Nonomuraea dietziae]|uniref:hypothetical protein n=1 Tax=Nonomuraea dietziae TaxID=65515 RepID=UPI0033C42AC7